MRKKLIFIALLLFLSGIASAMDIGSIGLDELEKQFYITVSGDSQSFNITVTVLVVDGSSIDTLEKAVADLVNSDFLDAKPTVKTGGSGNYTVEVEEIRRIRLMDNDMSIEDLDRSNSIIILVGGSEHNTVSRQVYGAGYITNETESFGGQLTVGTGKTESGNSIAVISHNRIPGLQPREAVKYSPLRKYVSEQYIPIVATGISIVFLYLFNILRTVFEFAALDLGRKKVKYEYHGKRLFGVKIREMISLLGASLVLGMAISWTFFAKTPEFLYMLAFNSILSLFAALSHEVTHRILGKILGIRMEYKFWWYGSAITMVSSYLGNAFGIQGFLLEEETEKLTKWKHGIVVLSGPMTSTIIMILFALLNLTYPHTTYQMIYSIAGLWAMAEILPVKPLDGYYVRKWSHTIWFVAFLAVTAAFAFVNFFL